MTAGVLNVPPLAPLRHVEVTVQKREEEETGFVSHKAGLNQDTTTQAKDRKED
jgi:hypothetical protein